MHRAIVFRVFLLALLATGCSGAPEQGLANTISGRQSATLADVKISPDEQAAIRALIEQLVLAEEPANNEPTQYPGISAYAADGKPTHAGGDAQKVEEDRMRFASCQAAFQQLAEFQIASFPLLMEHLDDKRQSIDFRNHYLGSTVGDACRWNIYCQLVDTPENYSNYGYSRPGRDGKSHPRPAWDGTPFDDAGGVRQWLEENKSLTYVEMQIKCLRWILDREKAIGVSDKDSYFVNILPLEVRILERRQQAGEDVAVELAKLRLALAEKDPSAIPSELWPSK